MKGITLCSFHLSDGHDVAFAQERGYGIEVQDFMSPVLLDAPRERVATWQQRLARFPAPRSFHGPFMDLAPGSVDARIVAVTEERIAQSVPVAARLGCRELVFHNGQVRGSLSTRGWGERAAAMWRRILADAPGASICIENYVEPTPDSLRETVDAVADPRLGICLDVGHTACYSRTDPVEWVRALGARIRYVHLHDNDGTSDSHLPLGEGVIPLRAVLAALEEHAPNATWALESASAPGLDWLSQHRYL